MRKAFVEPVALPEPRFRDGLGIRYVRTDGTDDPVEVLRPLWDVGMMQNAIRQRVSRLASFRQARFVPVRAAEVPRDDASTIEIVSDYTSGHRLSQYLEASKAGVVSIETSSAIYILRELLGALALLHESRGVTHGAVGPERILITPKGRVVVADYVLGPAIERLEFTRPRLWREFRIPVPAGKGQPKLDDKADVLQVAVTALALLLGRPVDLAEYPEHLESLLAALGQAQRTGGRTLLPAALVGWLKRALFKDPNGKFANVSDARLSHEAVLSKQDAATGGAAALKALADAFGRHAAALEAQAAAAAAEEARKAALAAQAATQAALREQAAAEAAAAPIIELVPALEITPGAPAASAAALQDASPVPGAESDPPVGWRVPEAPADEETLPTSPLIQLDAPAPAATPEAFVEEVLDLAGIAGPEDQEPAAAATLTPDAASAPAEPMVAHALAPELETASAVVEVLVDLRDLAAGDAVVDSQEATPAPVEAEPASIELAEAQAVVEVPPPVVSEQPPAAVEHVAEVLAALEREPTPPPPADDLPEWRLLADPVGAAAPTIDVDVPTESLDELVAAFAATIPAAPEPHADAAGHPLTLASEPETVEPVISAPEQPTVERELSAFAWEAPAEGHDGSALAAEAQAVEPYAAAVAAEVPVLEAEAPAVEPHAAAVAAELPVLESESQPSVQDVPTVAMEPPAIMVKAPVPFFDVSAAIEAPAGAAPLDEEVPSAPATGALVEILGLQEAQAAAQSAVEFGQEAPPASPDVSAWNFVEELLHHDARFERHDAADADGPPPAVSETPAIREVAVQAVDLVAPVIEQTPPILGSTLPDLQPTPLALESTPPVPEPAPPVPERAVPFLRETARVPGLLDRTVEDDAPGIEDAASGLPPDWLIEVRPEPAAMPSPALSAASSEGAAAPPPLTRRAPLPEPEDDLSGPVFPRVAPSVQRVRAEARRRRMARLGTAVSQGFLSVANGLASALMGVAQGAAAVLMAAGRGSVAVVGAIAAGVVAALAALGRGLGGLVRAAAAGLAALARGVATGSAAAGRGIATVVTTAGGGALRLARATAHASGAAIGAVAKGTGRALRALSSGAAASAGAASKALVAAVRAAASVASIAARTLAAGLAGLGRAGSAAVSGIARMAGAASAGAGRAVGHAAGRTASAASATGTLVGRGAAVTGKGIGRAAATLPRRLYFLVADVADRLPRPIVRPWYLAAALVVIAAVAGVPYARARLSTVKPEVGIIRVESARPDEQVTIDGVPQGRVPVTASVPAGRHRVEVGRAGQMRAHEVDVAVGRETLLQAAGPNLKATGSLRVTTEPPGADVLIDGMLHGTSPLTIDNLAEGAHALLVRDKSGSVRQTVEVKPDATTDAALQLRPGWLAVFAPVRLQVLENGRPIGSTEGGRMLASPGPHTVEVVSQAMGFRETRHVEIKPGQVSAVTIQMPPVTIEIVAPADAEILVDGQVVGQAPLGPLEVAVGTREITMRHPTLGERRQVVSVTYNAPVKVSFE